MTRHLFIIGLIATILLYVPAKAHAKIFSGISIIELLLFVLFYVVLLRKFLRRKSAPETGNSNVLVLIVFFVGAITMSFLYNGFESGFNLKMLSGLLHYYLGVAFFLVSYNRLNEIRYISKTQKALFFAAIIIFAVALIQKIIGPGASLNYMNWTDEWVQWATEADFRVYSLLGNPLHVSVFFCFIFGISLTWLVGEPEKKHLFLIAMTIVGIALTKSKSPVLTTIILMPLSYYAVRKIIPHIKSRKMNLSFPLLLGLIAVILSVATFTLADRMEDFRRNEVEVYGTSVRLLMVQVAVNAIFDNPFTGVGPGGLVEYFRDHSNLAYIPESSFTADNILLQMGAEIGLIGLVLFLLINFYAFKNAFLYISGTGDNKEKLLILGLLIGLCGFYFQSMFESSTILPLRALLWTTLGMFAALKSPTLQR